MSSRSLTRILCVEDDSDIQTVAQIALEAVGGFEILMCSSGKEALEKASAFNPDLVLLDVMMPDMDGPSTLEALRKLDAMSAVPVVFMTAKVQPSEIQRYQDLGSAGVIVKPFDPMLLSDQVRELWREWSGR